MKLLHQYPISTISVSDGTILNSFRFRGLTHSLRQFTTIVAILKFENGHLLCAPDSTRLDSTRIPIPMLGIRTRVLSVWLRYCATVNVRRRPGTEMETEIECGPNTDKTKYESEQQPKPIRRAPPAECPVPCAESAVLKRLPIALGSNARGMRLKGG